MRMVPRSVLAGWIDLEESDGLRRIRNQDRAFWFLGFSAWIVAAGCAFYAANAWLTLGLAAVAGGLTTETNARSRARKQWPGIRHYLDWQHIRADLNESD